MPSLKRDDVEASLKRKGFAEEERDHRFYKLVVGGKYTGIFTKTSRGKSHKTLTNILVNQMAKQVKLTTQEFVGLVDCSLSEAQYVDLLRQRDEL